MYILYCDNLKKLYHNRSITLKFFVNIKTAKSSKLSFKHDKAFSLPNAKLRHAEKTALFYWNTIISLMIPYPKKYIPFISNEIPPKVNASETTYYAHNFEYLRIQVM